MIAKFAKVDRARMILRRIDKIYFNLKPRKYRKMKDGVVFFFLYESEKQFSPPKIRLIGTKKALTPHYRLLLSYNRVYMPIGL